MIELSRDAGSEVILAGMQIPPNYGSSYTSAFAQVYADLADELEVGLIPFFMDGVALNSDYLLPDRIHPNAEGQPILLDNAWAVLKPVLQNYSGAVEASLNAR